MDIDAGKPVDDDRLVFAGEDAPPLSGPLSEKPGTPWKILVVDDEADIHKITELTLKGFTFDNRPIQMLSAYSNAEARQVFKDETDIALVLLDVVMEENDSGLKLVEYIRKELGNESVRIVLRTGQPGKAPETEVITRYDINDYKTKPEFTAQKLFTTVTACIRAYQTLETIRRNAQGLEAIIRSSEQVFKNQSFSKMGDMVLERLMDIFHADRPSDAESAYCIGMPESDIRLMAGTGLYQDRLGQSIEEAMPDNVLRIVDDFLQTGGEVFDNDAYTGVFTTKEGFRSILHIGQCSRLSSLQRKLIRVYANNIAIGFDNISLAREIINTQKEVILTLGEVVETRSQETAHHVTRVAEVCYLLAFKYGLPEEECELLRLASPMHDVGKIGIPEAILNKPARLTSEEFKAVQKHSRIGYEILNKSNRAIMKAAAIVALQHHERWDGSGYPQGLAGPAIHIFGRIAAVADVFDALSHSRCYKDAWEMDQVIDLFRAESGIHFDSDLVEVLLSNIGEFQAINRRFPA